MLTVNQLQGLKKLTAEHDAILFDDFSKQDMDDDSWLAVFDTSQDQDIRVLRACVTKRKDLKQIFTFNAKTFQPMSHLFWRQEFTRRCHVVKIPLGSLY